MKTCIIFNLEWCHSLRNGLRLPLVRKWDVTTHQARYSPLWVVQPAVLSGCGSHVPANPPHCQAVGWTPDLLCGAAHPSQKAPCAQLPTEASGPVTPIGHLHLGPAIPTVRRSCPLTLHQPNVSHLIPHFHDNPAGNYHFIEEDGWGGYIILYTSFETK